MKTRALALGSAALLLSQLLPVAGMAANFTDVSDAHIYQEQIETLAGRGIIKGNPDNSFKPEKTVNRAELLIMLYRAAGKNPGNPSKACFKDSGTKDWYSAVVCDAAKNKYIGGYPDGNFRPGQEVNRVESLKMIHTVLNIQVNSRASTEPLTAYSDVSLTAWYAPYMANAFAQDILPIAGQTGSRFFPEKALTRGEAAAYIFNALGLELTGGVASSSSSAQARSSRSTASASTNVRTINVDFPFEDDGQFDGKKSLTYVFNLQKPVAGSFKVTLDAGTEDGVHCRLFKLATGTSFAMEYYIGQIVGNECWLQVSLGNGSYQFEVIPRIMNANFRVFSTTVISDGNDGFREADLLQYQKAKTSTLAVGDYADWYYFKLAKEQKLTVEATGSDNTRCIIYPMDDVNLLGFSGPNCGEEYTYPAGTYYVGVMRKDGRMGEESFTVRYR